MILASMMQVLPMYLLVRVSRVTGGGLTIRPSAACDLTSAFFSASLSLSDETRRGQRKVLVKPGWKDLPSVLDFLFLCRLGLTAFLLSMIQLLDFAENFGPLPLPRGILNFVSTWSISLPNRTSPDFNIPTHFSHSNRDDYPTLRCFLELRRFRCKPAQ